MKQPVRQISISEINDDDIYVIDTNTNEVIQHLGSKERKPCVPSPLFAYRGMSLKRHGLTLWAKASV